MDAKGTTVMSGSLSVKSAYREGLPPLPRRMEKLPVDRGYPVPWFVAKTGDGYDFRVADGRKWAQAVQEQLCWLCGEQLGVNKVFVLGPMCTITRTTSEPPSHRDCATFAVVACPFLTQQETGYRTGNLPEGAEDPGGCAIKRQPGCSALWTTESFKVFDDGKGKALLTVGDPREVSWWSHGRHAYIGEIHESITIGFPVLFEMAQQDGLQGILQLNRELERAVPYTLQNPWRLP